MVEQGLSQQPDRDAFRLVGAGYRSHVSQGRDLFWRARIKGMPLFSMAILLLIVLGCVFAPLLANHDPTDFYLSDLNRPPGQEFRFGTDSLGRDLYSMMWYGGRVSILVGLLGASIIAAIGIPYGCISGVAGERVDFILMRFAELCGSIPSILFVLVLSAAFGDGSVVSISIIIGITGWFGLARIVRGEVRQIRDSEFILYARACHASFPYVMIHHLVPNLVSAIMFVLVSSISSCMIMESTLSFLGLGLPVTTISWGSMLSLANKALLLDTWWVVIFPGLFLVTTLLCITNIAYHFRKEGNRKASNL